VTYFLAFAGFAVLIILHEFGHFAAAKATGMRVERFFLFFPPKLVSKRRGETEYGIGAIPLGGFVKITGMNPDEELPPDVAPRAYYHQPVWKRIVVIGAGPAVNILLAFIILFVLAFGAEKATTLEVSKVEQGTPAAKTLKVGDQLISVDGVRANPGDLEASATRFSDTIDSHRCAGGETTPTCRAATPARLVIVRDGKRQVVLAKPFYDANVGRNRLGFGFRGGDLVPDHTGPVGAADRAVDFMWLVTHKTAEVFANIFDAEQRKQVSGVVGSYEVTRQAISFSAREALTLLAVISLSLGLINLFPFLPLDGGHIFWSLVEKVRGRPVPFRVMERAGALGFVLIMLLFFIGLQNDIGRLTGEGFNVR
jgi:regulator of sigma E protease